MFWDIYIRKYFSLNIKCFIGISIIDCCLLSRDSVTLKKLLKTYKTIYISVINVIKIIKANQACSDDFLPTDTLFNHSDIVNYNVVNWTRETIICNAIVSRVSSLDLKRKISFQFTGEFRKLLLEYSLSNEPAICFTRLYSNKTIQTIEKSRSRSLLACMHPECGLSGHLAG